MAHNNNIVLFDFKIKIVVYNCVINKKFKLETKKERYKNFN